MDSRATVARVRRLGFRVFAPLLLDRVNLTFPGVFHGKWLKVPTVGRVGYSNFVVSDPWMFDLLRMLVHLREGAIVDVGVNLGQTLIKAVCVRPGVRYVGFEPNPVCMHYVRELVKRNGFRNCELVPVGLSDVSGLATLDLYGSETDSAASIVQGFRGGPVRHRLVVPVMRLDAACQELDLQRISILKIDVEGGELEVIKGAERLLAATRPFIVCEVLPVHSEGNVFRRNRQEALEEMVRGMGYCVCRVEKDKRGCLSGLKPIESIGVHSDFSLCDYVLIPGELVGRVLG